MRVGVIYNIVYQARCVYVGSSFNYNQRLHEHKSRCHNTNANEYNYNLYKFIRNTDVWAAFQFKVIDTMECDDSDVDRGKNELHAAEQFYIDLLEPTLNGRDASVDKKERRKKQNEATKNINQRNKDTKRFYCEPCGYAAECKSNLEKHYTSNNHKNKMN